MKQKLLVSGCSMTHGAELHNGFMHEENVKRSYSAYLARYLDTELVNVALSGGSNEYIFHSVVENLNKLDNIHSVVVMWTGPERLYWKNQDRHWFILGNWASSMVDLVNFKMHDKKQNGVWFTGDSDQVVDELSDVHSFFVRNYFDHNEMTKKTKNYQQALAALCKIKNIKLVDLSVNDLTFYKLVPGGRHPTDAEHQAIAKFILEKYYETNTTHIDHGPTGRGQNISS